MLLSSPHPPHQPLPIHPRQVVVIVTHSGFTRSLLLAVEREPYRPNNAELVPVIVDKLIRDDDGDDAREIGSELTEGYAGLTARSIEAPKSARKELVGGSYGVPQGRLVSKTAGSHNVPHVIKEAGNYGVPHQPEEKVAGSYSVPHQPEEKVVGSYGVPHQPEGKVTGSYGVPDQPEEKVAGSIDAPTVDIQKSAGKQ